MKEINQTFNKWVTFIYTKTELLNIPCINICTLGSICLVSVLEWFLGRNLPLEVFVGPRLILYGYWYFFHWTWNQLPLRLCLNTCRINIYVVQWQDGLPFLWNTWVGFPPNFEGKQCHWPSHHTQVEHQSEIIEHRPLVTQQSLSQSGAFLPLSPVCSNVITLKSYKKRCECTSGSVLKFHS